MTKPKLDDSRRGTAHTIAEIAQQPSVWRQVGGRVEGLSDFVAPLLDDPRLRIILTGAGSSAFAGQVVAPGLRRGVRRRIEAVATTDVVANPVDYLGEDVPTLLVSFARSGDSPRAWPRPNWPTNC